MSMHFERPLSEDETKLLRQLVGEPVAYDTQNFLFDDLSVVNQKDMSRLANAINQPVTVEINAEGEIKTMRDGTKYRVTPRGWRKIAE